MTTFLILLTLILTIAFPVYRHIQARKQNIHSGRRAAATAIFTAVIFFLGIIIVGAVAPLKDSPDDSDSVTVSHKKTNNSKNMPGEKINSSLAKEHEFYWTSKDDPKVRYFVDDNKKITAIKYVLRPDLNNTTHCQSVLANILHDNNLKYTTDKTDESDIVLNNDKEYNIYSPKNKKWYRVSFDPVEKDLVATFSLYPGKSADAE